MCKYLCLHHGNNLLCIQQAEESFWMLSRRAICGYKFRAFLDQEYLLKMKVYLEKSTRTNHCSDSHQRSNEAS